jgi:hypothetical protein
VKVPEVRERLHALARRGDLPAPVRDELTRLAGELYRRPGRPVAPTSRPMTPEVRADIWRLRELYPAESQQWIAQRAGVNPGRVSEVLHGFRA